MDEEDIPQIVELQKASFPSRYQKESIGDQNS